MGIFHRRKTTALQHNIYCWKQNKEMDIPLIGASGMNPPACSAAAAAAAANARLDAVLLLLLFALTATESPARARAFFLFFCPLVRFGLWKLEVSKQRRRWLVRECVCVRE